MEQEEAALSPSSPAPWFFYGFSNSLQIKPPSQSYSKGWCEDTQSPCIDKQLFSLLSVIAVKEKKYILNSIHWL